GKTADAPPKFDDDIKNIGGATLSSRHLTDGVRRLLATYAAALK
ncbi:MAG: FMN-binding protein, partial [Betaproteobacteria bacterium]